MATAADIGANFSSYEGNANLGGGTFGSGQLDTRPIQDFARYVMLYNKAEYDQRQKDAEKAADQIASIASYDLTSSIPKDAKVLQESFDKLLDYVRENPEALNYKNKEAWAQYNAMKSKLENDIKSSTKRTILYDIRQKEISDEVNPDRKRLLQQRLDAEVEQTDIRTPLRHSQKYDVALPSIPQPTGYKFDVYRAGANADINREFELFNVAQARANGNVFAMDLDETIDLSTPEGQERAIARKGNFWIQGAEQLNAALQSMKDAEGNIDPSKLKGLSKQLVGLIEQTNLYLKTKKDEIKAGVYKDKFKRPITFGGGLVKEEDYDLINYADGVSPDELALVAQYAAWKGDGYKTKTIETDDQIQQEQLANQRRGQDLENSRYYAGLKYKNTEDLLNADAVVREVSDVVRAAKNSPQVRIHSGKNERIVSDIADPNILREFGNIDKDGNVTNVPDKIYFDEKANSLSLVYFKRDDSDQIIQDTKGGKPIEREVKLAPTQWMGQIVKRKNPNKDIGGVNMLVDQIYNKYDRSLIKMVDNYTGGATTTTTRTTEGGASTSGSKWDQYREK